MAPSLFMVDVRKAAGDMLEYHKVSSVFYVIQNFHLVSQTLFVSLFIMYKLQMKP